MLGCVVGGGGVGWGRVVFGVFGVLVVFVVFVVVFVVFVSCSVDIDVVVS